VRLRLPGKNPFLIQGVSNVKRLLNAGLSVTNPAHGQNFIVSQLFGMPRAAAQMFEKDDSGYAATPRAGSNVKECNRVCYKDRKLLMDMLSGPELEGVIARFQAAFDKRMGKLAARIENENDWVQEQDLWEFLTTHVTPAAIEALCGPALVDVVDKDFVQDFWRFDDWVPAITKGAPAWLFPRAYAVRDKLLASLVRWRNMLLHRRGGDDDAEAVTPSMMAKMDLLDVEGWSVQAIAALDLGLIWA
jgi:hypothetical protein